LAAATDDNPMRKQMNLRQLFLFLTVGSLAAIVNFSTFAICLNMLGWNYKVSVTVSYILSIITHFFGNRHMTFKKGHLSIVDQLKKYSVALVVNYFLTLAVVTMCVEGLHLSPYLGLVAAIGLGLGVNYSMARFWVFREA
jgi:putative flippase GtrA